MANSDFFVSKIRIKPIFCSAEKFIRTAKDCVEVFYNLRYARYGGNVTHICIVFLGV